jgi:hypothetical protein
MPHPQLSTVFAAPELSSTRAATKISARLASWFVPPVVIPVLLTALALLAPLLRPN